MRARLKGLAMWVSAGRREGTVSAKAVREENVGSVKEKQEVSMAGTGQEGGRAVSRAVREGTQGDTDSLVGHHQILAFYPAGNWDLFQECKGMQ